MVEELSGTSSTRLIRDQMLEKALLDRSNARMSRRKQDPNAHPVQPENQPWETVNP